MQGFCFKIKAFKLAEDPLRTFTIIFNQSYLEAHGSPGLQLYLAPQNSSVDRFRLKPFETEMTGDIIKYDGFAAQGFDITVSKVFQCIVE